MLDSNNLSSQSCRQEWFLSTSTDHNPYRTAYVSFLLESFGFISASPVTQSCQTLCDLMDRSTLQETQLSSENIWASTQILSPELPFLRPQINVIVTLQCWSYFLVYVSYLKVCK